MAVLKEWNLAALDERVTELETPVSVVFATEDGHDEEAFRIVRRGITAIASDDILAKYYGDRHLVPSCVELGSEGNSVAQIVFENNGLTHAIEVKGPGSMKGDGRDPDVRLLLRAPTSIDELSTLWDRLNDAVTVRPLGPADYGFVAHVTKRRAQKRPTIQYAKRPTPLKIQEIDRDTRLPELCLIHVRNTMFYGASELEWPTFDYAYVQARFVRVSDDGDEFEYELFVVPAMPTGGTVMVTAPIIAGLVSVCGRFYNVSRRIDEECSRWENEVFDEAFLELSRAIDGKARSAKLEVVWELLSRRDGAERETAINLPGGAGTIAVRGTGGLAVIVVVLVLLQGYLLVTIQMALSYGWDPSVGAPKQSIPWVALFSGGLPFVAWRVSLVIPPVSIIGSCFFMLTPIVSVDEIMKTIGYETLAFVVHAVGLFVSGFISRVTRLQSGKLTAEV